MKIAVAGSSGLVGTKLLSSLRTQGDEVVALVRRHPGESEIFWDPAKAKIAADALEGFDAVINLAGDNIGEGRWTASKKNRILLSRTNSTLLLAEHLAQLEEKPKVWVNASAIGYYGNRGTEELTESSSPGKGFLADVCQQWEAATQPAIDAGIRVVKLRIGVVLSKDGGGLAKMLFPFKMGGGGIVGSGKQFWSWVSLTDVVSMIRHCVVTESLEGPVNGTSPNPSTNLEFTKTLGRVLGRPTIVPMPGFLAKLLLGEMVEDLLLSSTRVLPTKLVETGFDFQHTELDAAIRAELGLT